MNLPVIHNIVQQAAFRGESISEELLNETYESYELLNIFLTKTKFVAGNEVTLADFSLFATITTINLFVPIDEAKYPKVAAWIKAIKELPCARENEAGLKQFEAAVAQFKK